MGSNYSGTISFDSLDLQLNSLSSDFLLCLTVDGQLTVEGYSGDYNGPQDGALPPYEEVTDVELWITEGSVPYIYDIDGGEYQLSQEEYEAINEIGLYSWLEEYWHLDIYLHLPCDYDFDDPSNDYEEDYFYGEYFYDEEDGMPSETTERIDYDPDC